MRAGCNGHKHFPLAVGAVALTCWLAACGGGGGGGSSTPPASPPSEPPPTQPPAQGGWTTAAAISSAAGGAGDVDVAMDAAGNVLAVWRQADSSVATHSLWASRYTPASGWSAPVELESDAATVDKFTLTLQPDSGRATVVWTQLTTAAAYDIWARTFDAAGGWGAIARVESQPGMVSAPSAGIDANGNSIAVWSQLGNFRYHVWASRHVPGSGWNTPVLLETLDQLGTSDTDARVAVAPNGDAQVVWQRSDGSSRSLWVNNFSAASGWGSARELVADISSSFSLAGQQLALDGSGGGLLVWGQWQFANSAQQSTVASKRFAAGWQSANVDVAPPVANDQISHPRLAINTAGSAAVAWVRKDFSLIASVATAGGQWGQATTLKPADAQPVTGLPDIALDDAGNGFAVWDRRNSAGSFDIWFSRYTPAAGWTAAATHEDSADPAQNPALAMNARGDAVVAWTQLFPTTGSRIVVRYYRNP